MKILFMCVANSARSQMAEGLARSILSNIEGPSVQVESAGSHPSKVNPFAIQAMREIGTDLGRHYSKSVDQLPPQFVAGLDCVITLCTEEVCPTLTTKAKKLHWPFPDPAGQGGSDEEQLQRFRAVRDAIRGRIEEFSREISEG